MIESAPLILTLRMDKESHSFFNQQRLLHFPPSRNFLQAHLTLYHKIPDDAYTYQVLQDLDKEIFKLAVTGLIHLGNGVAYKIESAALHALQLKLRSSFENILTAQDKQGFRPHITIQNKVPAETANKLFKDTSGTFKPMEAEAVGLDLWRYLNGPWEHVRFYPFKLINKNLIMI